MKVLLLFSGGKESVFSLHQLIKQGHIVRPMIFNYGQKSFKAEHRSMLYYYEKYRPSMLGACTAPACIRAPQAIYRGEDGDDHVIFRNGIFLSMAINHAIHSKMDAVSIGATRTGDHGDASDKFLKDFSALIKPMYPQIKVISPTAKYSGYEIFGKVMHKDIDSSMLWSCMNSKKKFCMECKKCKTFIADFNSGKFAEYKGYNNYLKFAEKFYGLRET